MNTSVISRKRILTALLCLASVACNKREEVTEYNIKEKIDQYRPQLSASDSLALTKFDVCQLFPASGWDRVLIVHPYATPDQLQRLNLNNFSHVKDEFRQLEHSDFYIGFLFVKEQDIVSYSISTREVRFDGLSSFTKEECQNLRITRHASPDTSNFHVVLPE